MNDTIDRGGAVPATSNGLDGGANWAPVASQQREIEPRELIKMETGESLASSSSSSSPTTTTITADVVVTAKSEPQTSNDCMLNELKTNDSPIHAVNELTNGQRYEQYTVEWKPDVSTQMQQERVDRESNLDLTTTTEQTVRSNNGNMTASVASSIPIDYASNGIRSREEVISVMNHQHEDDEMSDSTTDSSTSRNHEILTSSKPPKFSLLEETVGKLKTSIDNANVLAFATTSNVADMLALQAEVSQHASVSLPPSSASPNYLEELMYRSQVNRRKMRHDVKRCPPPIFRGGGDDGINRRGRPLRPRIADQLSFMQNFSSAAAMSMNNQSICPVAGVPYGGLDLSTETTQSYAVTNNINASSYFINRQPLRKVIPKTKPTPITKPLSLQIDHSINNNSNVQANAARSPSQHQMETTLPLVSPLVSRSIKTSPCNSPPLFIDESNNSSSGSSSSSPCPQDQPMDLCTKPVDSPKSASPIQIPVPLVTPPAQRIDDNQPLNLSTKKKSALVSESESDASPTIHMPRGPFSLPPATITNNSIFWKTPPRGDFLGFHKSVASVGESASPLEGDTPSSGPAANSPGLDNQRLPYNLLMSPQLGYNLPGMLPLGQLSPTDQFHLQEAYPEGSILLNKHSPHYRLSPRMALQHNEPPTPERPYMCDECGATFKRNKSLKQHRRVHIDNAGQPLKCGECNKIFRNINMLKQHQQVEHATTDQHMEHPVIAKLYSCDVCPRRFAHPEKLKRHLRIHNGEKPYICETDNCGKRFTDASQLKLHMRTHSNHKPFPCPYCPLRFKYSGDVKRHVRIHTGEKPYVCGYCKMRFTQSNTLKQHERTHTGERPYHCHKCGMTFTQSGSLKYHLAHRHPQDVTYILTSSASSIPPSASVVTSSSLGLQLNN